MVNNKTCFLFCTALLLIFISAGALFAQQNLYQVNHFDSRKGLSNNQVNSIYKDERGFDVNKFVEDKAGNLWIGTNGGGLIYFDRKAGTYKRYVHSNTDPNSLTNNVIVSLFIDTKEKL